MAEAVGHEVVELERIRFGSVALGELEAGSARRLDEEEVARLWEDARSAGPARRRRPDMRKPMSRAKAKRRRR
jgi:hypothetical protein